MQISREFEIVFYKTKKDLAERTKFYLLGMPGKDGEVFPPRCNMENKLDKLET